MAVWACLSYYCTWKFPPSEYLTLSQTCMLPYNAFKSMQTILNVFAWIYLHLNQCVSVEQLYHMFVLLISTPSNTSINNSGIAEKLCRSRLHIKHFLQESYVNLHGVPDVYFIVFVSFVKHLFYFWRTSCFLIRKTRKVWHCLVWISCRIIYAESLQIFPECTRMLLQESLIAMKHIPCLLGDEASIRARHMLVQKASSLVAYHLRKRTWLGMTVLQLQRFSTVRRLLSVW